METKFICFLILGLFFISGCGSQNNPAIDSLATCLADNGIKEYGAFWCPNCAKQQKMFGDSYDILKTRGVYIECDPRCDVDEDELPVACRGVIGQTELCLEKEVNKYPDWEFPDGSRIVGVQELTTLAEKAGCSYSEA